MGDTVGHEQSGFRFYSLGVVAENKPIGKHECEVIPLEANNFVDGEITTRGQMHEVDLKNKQGTAFSDKVVSSVSIVATWTGIGESNRVTPPDVRRGEEVLIYTFADTGKYYWQPRNTNRHLRKLETVTHAFSGTTDEGDTSVGEGNHYIAEISTHQKHIVISTSDKNGEKCRWFIQIRGGDGKLIVADNNNNEIMIDSVGSIIRLINQFDAEIEMNKKNITMKVPGDHLIEVTGRQTINVKGNASFNVTGNATVKAATYALDAATITFNGNLVLNGNLSLNGGFTSSGGGTWSDYVNFAGGHGPH